MAQQGIFAALASRKAGTWAPRRELVQLGLAQILWLHGGLMVLGATLCRFVERGR